MPLTIVGMTRVFLDDLDRGPRGVSRRRRCPPPPQDDVQEMDSVTSTVSEYALSDDGIDEADFALDSKQHRNENENDDDDEKEEEEDSSCAKGLRNVVEESRSHEPEPDDETCEDRRLDGLRTPAPEEGRYYSYLPSIRVTEIDDFHVSRNSKKSTNPKSPSTCRFLEPPYATKARTRTARMISPQYTTTTTTNNNDNSPAMRDGGARGGSDVALGVSKFRYQDECKRY